MRTTRYLAAALVLAGCLLVLGATGAFTETQAERGVAVDTAQDQNAFLGLQYPSPGRTLSLNSGDAAFCGSYCWYVDEEMVVLHDNTAAQNLAVSNVTFQSSSTNMLAFGFDNVSHPSGIEAMEGTFLCQNSGGGIFDPAPPEQEEGSTDVTINLTVTSGNMTVDLSRTVQVECIADS